MYCTGYFSYSLFTAIRLPRFTFPVVIVICVLIIILSSVKGTSSPRSTGSLQREGMLTTAALLSGDELDIFGDDDEGDSGIFRVKEDKETDIADHRDVIEGNGQDETATDPEQRSSSPSDSSVSLG